MLDTITIEYCIKNKLKVYAIGKSVRSVNFTLSLFFATIVKVVSSNLFRVSAFFGV